MTRIRWENLPSTSTPLIDTNLNKANNVVISSTEPTTGEEVWLQKGKNLFDEKLEVGGITEEGELVDSTTRLRSKNFSSVNSSTIYTFKIEEYNTSKGYPKINVIYYDKDKKGIGVSGWKNNTYSFTTPSNCQFVKFLFYFTNSSSQTLTTSDITKSMLELGSSATTYEAYIPTKIYTKDENDNYNLLTETVHVGTEEGASRVNFIKGKNLIIPNTFVAGDLIGSALDIRVSTRQILWLKAGTYTISCNITSPFRYVVWVENVQPAPLSNYFPYIVDSGWRTSTQLTYTFTITTGGWFYLGLSKEQNAEISLNEVKNFNFQLEEGSTATSYEPYVTPAIVVDNDEIYSKIESGSNANGNYIKYPDGTMITTQKVEISSVPCTTQWGHDYNTGEINMPNFPVAFISIPAVQKFYIPSSGNGYIVQGTNLSTTNSGRTIIQRPTSYNSMSGAIYITAIGRWK